MWLISRKKAREFWARRPDSKEALLAWCREVEHAAWDSLADVKAKYGSASIVGNNHIVFNICGNKYRLIAIVHCRAKKVYVRFIGTHKEYVKITAGEV